MTQKNIIKREKTIEYRGEGQNFLHPSFFTPFLRNLARKKD